MDAGLKMLYHFSAASARTLAINQYGLRREQPPRVRHGGKRPGGEGRFAAAESHSAQYPPPPAMLPNSSGFFSYIRLFTLRGWVEKFKGENVGFSGGSDRYSGGFFCGECFPGGFQLGCVLFRGLMLGNAWDEVIGAFKIVICGNYIGCY